MKSRKIATAAVIVVAVVGSYLAFEDLFSSAATIELLLDRLHDYKIESVRFKYSSPTNTDKWLRREYQVRQNEGHIELVITNNDNNTTLGIRNNWPRWLSNNDLIFSGNPANSTPLNAFDGLTKAKIRREYALAIRETLKTLAKEYYKKIDDKHEEIKNKKDREYRDKKDEYEEVCSTLKDW